MCLCVCVNEPGIWKFDFFFYILIYTLKEQSFGSEVNGPGENCLKFKKKEQGLRKAGRCHYTLQTVSVKFTPFI